jgi:hypothetical protein
VEKMRLRGQTRDGALVVVEGGADGGGGSGWGRMFKLLRKFSENR